MAQRVTILEKPAGQTWSLPEVAVLKGIGLEIQQLESQPNRVVVLALPPAAMVADALGHTNYTAKEVDYNDRWQLGNIAMTTIFEDGSWLIQMSKDHDVFVLKKEHHATTTRPGPEIRIVRMPGGLAVAANSCRMSAGVLNNVPAVLVTLS